MTLFSILIALVIEQLRPLRVQSMVVAPLRKAAGWVLARFGGAAAGGRLAWWAMMLAGTLGSAFVFFFLWDAHPLLAFAFNVATLYLAMGFVHENQAFADIHLALRMGELVRARQLLGEWRGGNHDQAGESEVARLAIEQALLAAHRNVFAIVFWFVILPGPSGVVMYRLARFLAEDWSQRTEAEFAASSAFARRAFDFVDWLPVRLTAASFSVVGNFEDALYCWRTQSALWPDRASAILLASGGGALGVKLGMPIHESGEVVDRPEMGLGDEAKAVHMRGAVRLIWRALVVCLLLLGLLSIAGWSGS
jgi:adenosylcobinamide-phosphate synthase